MTGRLGVAAALAVLLPLGAGCSCGDTRVRPHDAAAEAAPPPTPPPGADAGPDAMHDARPADAADAAVGPDAADGALEDAADGAPADAADATEDAGPDGGPDAGCAPGLTGCVDSWTGQLVCVDLLRNLCHCGRCGRDFCYGCFDGACSEDCGGPFPYCRRGERCSDEEEFACADFDNDPSHCGECWHACAADERCVVGVCTPILPRDAGTSD